MDDGTIERREPEWTQDEAIAFEAARECIGHVISICSSLIAEEEGKAVPNVAAIEALELRQQQLAFERQDLRLKDHATIARVRAEYGAEVRLFHQRSHPIAAE